MASQSRPSPGDSRDRRATIRDVAAAASVSSATVSYVLNATPGQTISAATRARVHAAAGRLGYVRRVDDQAGRHKPVVLLNIGADAVGGSLSTYIGAMREELEAESHALVVTTDRIGVRPEVLAALRPRAVVDLMRPEAATWGSYSGTPVGMSFHAHEQLRYLASAGHRDIALAVPAERIGVFGRVRIEYAHRAARKLGLPDLIVVPVVTGPDPRMRVAALRELVLARAASAVATIDDDIAVAVLSAMAQSGLRAPDDLAVIGFDDQNIGQYFSPALTSIRIDNAAYGRRAARHALDLPAEDWEGWPSSVVERAST